MNEFWEWDSLKLGEFLEGSQPKARSAAGGVLRREEHLPDLQAVRAKRAGAGHQVEFPHAEESFVVVRAKFVPMFFEICIPGHERAVVVRRPVLQILHDEKIFRRGADLFQRRKHGIGEDVFFDPGIGDADGNVFPDARKIKAPAAVENVAHDLHECAVIL